MLVPMRTKQEELPEGWELAWKWLQGPWKTARGTYSSMQLVIVFVSECAHVCYGRLAAGVGYIKVKDNIRGTLVLAAKYPDWNPWYWLTVWHWAKQSDSLSSLFLSSERGNLISLACAVFPGTAWGGTCRSIRKDLNLTGGFPRKQKARDLPAWWPLHRDMAATPSPFQLLELRINCNQAKQTNKKVVIRDQQNGTNDVIHQDGHPNLPTIFS